MFIKHRAVGGHASFHALFFNEAHHLQHDLSTHQGLPSTGDLDMANTQLRSFIYKGEQALITQLIL